MWKRVKVNSESFLRMRTLPASDSWRGFRYLCFSFHGLSHDLVRAVPCQQLRHVLRYGLPAAEHVRRARPVKVHTKAWRPSPEGPTTHSPSRLCLFSGTSGEELPLKVNRATAVHQLLLFPSPSRSSSLVSSVSFLRSAAAESTQN